MSEDRIFTCDQLREHSRNLRKRLTQEGFSTDLGNEIKQLVADAIQSGKVVFWPSRRDGLDTIADYWTLVLRSNCNELISPPVIKDYDSSIFCEQERTETLIDICKRFLSDLKTFIYVIENFKETGPKIDDYTS